MTRFIFILCLVVTLNASGAAGSGDTAGGGNGSLIPKHPASELVALLNSIGTIKANYRQVVLGERGDVTYRASGEMLIKRPRQFKWNSVSPFPQQLISNGSILWIYDPDLAQVIMQQLPNDMAEIPALLLSGDASGIPDKFNVSVNNAGSIYTLTLKETGATYFDKFKLGFAGNVINSMSFYDGLGQTVKIDFSSVQQNIEVKDSEFTFNMIAGVDVVNNGI